MKPTADPYLTALSAIANVTTLPATRSDVEAVLRHATGQPAHVIALFSELTPETIVRIAILGNIPDASLARSYRLAKARYPFIANRELDEYFVEATTGIS